MSTAALELLITLKDEASDRLSSITGSLSGVGNAALAVAGGGLVALGAGLTSAVNAAGEFEAGMNNFASVAGGALAQAGFAMDDVKNKALELGAVTQFSAAQAQDAMINLAKGGVPVADIMGAATDATLALAAAGSLELGPAADIVSKQLGVWGETGVSAAQVADQLAQAANASTVDVAELAMGLSNVAGTAKTAGVDFGDLTQTMALIAPGFSSAADAGTSLKTMIAGLQPATGPAAAMFEKLGLMSFNTQKAMDALRAEGIEPMGTDFQTLAHQLAQLGESMGMSGKKQLEFIDSFRTSVFYDQAGAFVGMEQAATLLQGAVGDLSEADKVMALQTMFGSDAIRSAAAIANAGAPGFNAMGDAMTAAGSAADQSAIKQQGFAFALDSMKGTIETLQIVIGSALLPVLTSMIGAMTGSINGVLAFAQGIVSASDPVAALVTAINTVVPGFSAFVLWLQQAVSAAQPLIDLLGANLMPILAALGTVLGGAVLIALGGIVAGFIAAVAPIAALVAGLALLYAAWSNNFLGIQQIVANVWAYLQPIFTQLVTWFQTNIPIALAALSQLWTSTLLPALQTVGNFIMTTVVPALSQIWTWLSINIPVAVAAASATFQTIAGVIGTVATAIQTGLSTAITWLTGAWTTVATATTTAWNVISTAVSTAVNVISTIISAAWNTILLVSTTVWNAIAAVVGPPLETAAGVVSTAVASISAAVTGAWAGIQSATEPVWTAVSTAVSTATTAVQTAVDGVVSFLASVWSGAMAAAETATSGPWETIQSVITGVTSTIQTVVETATAIVQTAMTTAWSVIVAASENDFGSIPGIISTAWDDIKATFSTGVEEIKKTFSGVVADMKSIGGDIVSGIQDGISGAWGRFEKWISDQVAKIPEPIRNALGIGSPSRVMAEVVGLPIAQGIALGFSQGMPKVTTNLVNGVAGLMEKVASAVENGSKALAAVSGFQGSSGSGLSGFLAGIKDMAIQFNDAAVALGGRILGTATRFADTIGKVTAPIDTALKALGGLVDFVAPARANISAFIASMYVLLNALNNMAAMFEAKAIKAAATFAEGAGKMLAVVGPAIDALKKLPDLVVPAQSQVNAFGESLFLIVRELLNVAALFAAQSLQAGAAFGEAGAKLLGVVAPAIDALKKLPELVVPADGALATFGDALGRTVQALIQVASLFAQDAVDAAAKFAEGAGKAIGIVGTSVDSFTKLATFTGISQAAIDAFGAGLRMVLARLLSISSLFSREAIAAAGVFGEGAGKAISALGAGIDTLGKLVTFVAPAEANVSAFFRSLADLLEKMGSWSANFEVDMLEATAAFSAGVQKSVAGIGAAVDALGKLVDFTAPAEKHVSAFFLALADLLERMGSWAGSFEADMLASTATFAAGVSQSVAPLKGAIDSLSSFADFVPPAQKAVSAFFAALTVVLQQIQQVSALFGAEAVASAATFATNVATVVSQLKGALQAFGSLGDTSVKPAVLGAFMQAAQSLIAQMAAYLPPNAEVIGSNTIVGLINGIVGQRSNLIAAMTNTVLAAVQAAQATLGIASPSKVFEQLGQYTGQGMAGGMNAMQPAVASAGAGLGMAAVGGASGGVGSSRSGGAAGPINITFAAGAIAINGVQGGLNDKHLKTLAGYIKEDIGADMRGR